VPDTPTPSTEVKTEAAADVKEENVTPAPEKEEKTETPAQEEEVEDDGEPMPPPPTTKVPIPPQILSPTHPVVPVLPNAPVPETNPLLDGLDDYILPPASLPPAALAFSMGSMSGPGPNAQMLNNP